MSQDEPAGIPIPDPLPTASGVTLRPFTLDDVAGVNRALQDPDIARWTRIPQPYTEEAARRWIEDHERMRTEGTQAPFAAVDPVTDELLASVGLVRIDLTERIAEVGYWVAAWARGRGVAAIGTRLVSEWAIGDLGIQRVELLASPDNPASCRSAENAGFTREGLLREARFAPRSQTERQDLVLYSLLASDIPAGV